MCGCDGTSDEIITDLGTQGIPGYNGWSPLYAVVTDGAREVLKISGWTGGTGTPPSITNQYLGPVGIVSSAASAQDIRGATGATGSTGAAGVNGWTPVYAVVSNGSGGDVLQIVDWTGGTTGKPSSTNVFVGAVGFVNTAAAAVNIRGATGSSGADLTNGRVNVSSDDTTINYLDDKLLVEGLIKTKNNPGANENLTLSLLSTMASMAKKVVRVNAAETGYEAVTYISSGYSEINSNRTETSGTPHIDSEATIFTITTPNDGVTRDYHIILTSVIDASNVPNPFGYNSYFKIGSTYLSSNTAQIDNGSRIVYTHNAVLTSVPPNTAILIRDKRTLSTTGTVNLSKLTYMGIAV